MLSSKIYLCPLALMAQAGICRKVIESGHKEAQKAQEE